MHCSFERMVRREYCLPMSRVMVTSDSAPVAGMPITARGLRPAPLLSASLAQHGEYEAPCVAQAVQSGHATAPSANPHQKLAAQPTQGRTAPTSVKRVGWDTSMPGASTFIGRKFPAGGNAVRTVVSPSSRGWAVNPRGRRGGRRPGSAGITIFRVTLNPNAKP